MGSAILLDTVATRNPANHLKVITKEIPPPVIGNDALNCCGVCSVFKKDFMCYTCVTASPPLLLPTRFPLQHTLVITSSMFKRGAEAKLR